MCEDLLCCMIKMQIYLKELSNLVGSSRIAQGDQLGAL